MSYCCPSSQSLYTKSHIYHLIVTSRLLKELKSNNLWHSIMTVLQARCSEAQIRLVLGPTQPSVQWVLRFFLDVKWPGPVVNHTPPSSTKVKNEWSCSPYPFTTWRGVTYFLSFYMGLWLYLTQQISFIFLVYEGAFLKVPVLVTIVT
jgi:hypothetical protein